MNVYRGAGTKVHTAVVVKGVALGTRCALDVRYNNDTRHYLTVTDQPVNCRTCLGNAAIPKVAIPKTVPVVVPATCPNHQSVFYATKTVKAGTYTIFSCGCRVWH